MWLLVLTWFFPEPLMQWVDNNKNVIEVRLEQPFEDTILQCIQKGFWARYITEVRVCRSNAIWFDSCNNIGERRVRIRTNVLNERITIEEDRIGDKLPAISADYSTLSEAIGRINSKFETTDLLSSASSDYLQSRVTAYCERDGTLRAIPPIISFGLLEASQFDSGWVDFLM